MKPVSCLLAILCLYLSTVKAQNTNTISGKIITPLEAPISGAGLTLRNSKRQTLSGINGAFTLKALIFPDTLIIEHTGYATKHIIVTASTSLPLSIILEPTTTTLDEVVVNTGYQDIPKERIAGSFFKIDNTLFNRRFSTNVIERLEGLAPGLVFNRNTIASTSGSLDLSIRGQNTLFANAQPLIVVDNFPYDGDINNLNAADIESITLLKDAAAASIWGARSGNGVIVITTKKGKQDLPLSVNLISNVNIGARPDLFYSPNFLPSSDFISLEQELFNRNFYNADLSNINRPPVSPVVELLALHRAGQMTTQALNTALDQLRSIDIRNEQSKHLYQSSIQQQYAINLRGGSKTSHFAISAGSDNNRSNIVGNTYSRETFSGQLALFPTKKIELSFSLNYTNSKSTNNGITDLTAGGSAAKRVLPYTKLLDEQGNPLSIVKEYRQAYLDTAGRGLLYDWSYKPMQELTARDLTTRLSDNRIALGFKYNFLKGLQAEIRYQQQYANTIRKEYYSSESYFSRDLINRFTSIAGNTVTRAISEGGILDQQSSAMRTHRLRAQLNYQFTTSVHKLHALAGTEMSNANAQSFSHRFYGYNEDNTTQIPVDNSTLYRHYITGANIRIPSEDALRETNNRFLSYFFNAGYTFKSAYTVTMSGRIDKSNFFGVNTNLKQVPLYSFGTVWDITKEKWFNSKSLSELSVRATYGFNANLVNHITAYTTAMFGSASPYYSRQPYAVINTPGNPSLRWEKIRMINTALEFALRNKKLSGTIEYYFKKGMDLAAESPLAPSSGFTSFTGNYAQTSGHGFDLSLQSFHQISRSLAFNTNLLVSGVWDKVVRYTIPSTSAAYILYGYGNAGRIYPLEGSPLYSQFSYRWGGLDATNGDPIGYLDGKASKDYAGIISKTPLDSMVYNGTTRPVITTSLRQDIRWKNFSFSFNIIGKLGYVFRTSTIAYSSLFTSWAGHADYLNRWQKPGDEAITQIPSLQFPPTNSAREQFYTNAANRIEKADHIRLQDIRLAWLWEKQQHPKFPFSKLEFSIYANNIGILWRANKKGLDPDLFAGSMPLSRSISFGINAHF